MSLFKQSGIYLSSNILNALVPFLLLPVLTHNLNPDEYGQIAMLQTLIAGLAAFMGLNTTGAANRKFYDKATQDELAVYNSMCLLILIISSLLIFLFVAIFSSYFSYWLNIPQLWVFLAVLISGGTFIIQFRLGQWQIRGQAVKFGFTQVSQSLFIFVLTLWLLLDLKQGKESRVNALVIVTIAYSCVCLLSLFNNRLLLLNRFNLEYFKDAWNFGLPLVPHVVGIFFLSAIDRILINTYLGVGEAGIYMLGVQLSLGMVVVFDAINKAMVPWLYRILADKNMQRINTIVRFTYLYFVTVLSLGVLSFWIGPFVISIISGNEYVKASSVIGWLCFGQAFNGMYLMVTNYIFYAKSTGRLSLITVSCGILNILLMIFMMKFNGIVGVSMAFAISMCIRFLSTWWLASRVCGFSWNIFVLSK